MGRPKINSLELEFENQVKTELDRFRDSLVLQFSKFDVEPPKGVKCLNFEIHSSYYDFPVTAVSMDEEMWKTIDGLDPPWMGNLLPSYDGDFISKALQENLDSYEALAIFTAEFLGDCWQQTIGKYPIPVLANHHDRQHYFDCRQNKWQ
ncbi:MAG: hypothetical protein AAGI63_18615 [Planctomycetota bacterium]